MTKRSCLAGTVVLVSTIVFGLPPADVLARQGRGGADQKAAKADKHGQVEAIAGDRDSHVRIIRSYTRAGALPPGLAKRATLPPGLQKQLHERGTLPPGLQKHLVTVPAALAAQMPVVPRHHQRYFVGDDLIVVDTRTRRIVVIMRDVWGYDVIL